MKKDSDRSRVRCGTGAGRLIRTSASDRDNKLTLHPTVFIPSVSLVQLTVTDYGGVTGGPYHIFKINAYSA